MCPNSLFKVSTGPTVLLQVPRVLTCFSQAAMGDHRRSQLLTDATGAHWLLTDATGLDSLVMGATRSVHVSDILYLFYQ